MGTVNYRGLETYKSAKYLAKGNNVNINGRWRPIDYVINIDGVVTAQIDWIYQKSWGEDETVHVLVWIPTND